MLVKEAAWNIAAVLAEEINRKQTLRCDQLVDVFQEFQNSSTRVLLMKKAPETCDNKERNEFSRL